MKLMTLNAVIFCIGIGVASILIFFEPCASIMLSICSFGVGMLLFGIGLAYDMLIKKRI